MKLLRNFTANKCKRFGSQQEYGVQFHTVTQKVTAQLRTAKVKAANFALQIYNNGNI